MLNRKADRSKNKEVRPKREDIWEIGELRDRNEETHEEEGSGEQTAMVQTHAESE